MRARFNTIAVRVQYLLVLATTITATSVYSSGVFADEPSIPLEILDFYGVEFGPGEYMVSGVITCDDPASRTVIFDGVLTGHSATTDQSGTFQLFVSVSEGLAIATVTVASETDSAECQLESIL